MNTEIKKPSRKETNQEEKTTKKIITSKNNIPNIYELTTGEIYFSIRIKMKKMKH